MSVWSSDVCSSDLVLLICDPVDDRPRSPATATLMSKTLMPRIDVQAENQRMDNIHAGSCLCGAVRSEEHTSELQSLMRISYAVFCLKKKKDIVCKIQHYDKYS